METGSDELDPPSRCANLRGFRLRSGWDDLGRADPPSRRGRAGRRPAGGGTRRRLRVELLAPWLEPALPPARGPGHRGDPDGGLHAVRPGRRGSQAPAGPGAGPGDRHRRSRPRSWHRSGSHAVCRSIDGKRPRRSSSGSTMTSATIACAQPRGRSPSGAAFFAINLDATFPGRAGRCSIPAAVLSPRRSPWRPECDRSRSASPSRRSFRSPSSGWAVQPTRRPWSATAQRPTSTGDAPPGCSPSGSIPKTTILKPRLASI